MVRITLQTSSAASPPVLQLMATSAPAWAKASATARPIPRELPVTNAFFPARLKSGTADSTSDDGGVSLPIDISSTPKGKRDGSGRSTQCLVSMPLSRSSMACSRLTMFCSVLYKRSNRPVMSAARGRPKWWAVSWMTWSCIPFKSVIVLRLFPRSSRNVGVRMKSSRLWETASSQRRWICCGSPTVCIASSSAWVPRLDCSSHWVQNEAIMVLGSVASLELGLVLVLDSMDGISVSLPGRADGLADRLDGHGNPLTAADTKRGDATLAAGPLQPGQKSDQDPRAGTADRVPERDGTAVDVGLLGRQAQFFPAGQSNDGESLVELKQIDIRDAPADLVQQFLDRPDRRGREPLRLLAMDRDTDNPRPGLQSQRLTLLRRGHQQCRGPIIDARGIAGSDGAVGVEGGTQAAHLALVELVQALVLADRCGHALDGDRDRGDLINENLVGDGLAGTSMALDREVVLLLAGEAKLGGALIGERTHRLVAVGVGQSVVHHGVHHLAVAHAVALAGLEQQIGRPAHALHAARDGHARVTHADHLVDQHHGSHPRGASLVDRHRVRTIREPAEDRRLARRVHTLASGDAGSHDDFIDTVGRHARPLQQRLDTSGPELSRRNPGKPSHEGPRRCPHDCHDQRLSACHRHGPRPCGTFS